MKKFNMERTRPDRSGKRKLVAGKELVSLRPRVPKKTKSQIEKEAKKLGVSESLYLNAIIETRNLPKIKQILDL